MASAGEEIEPARGLTSVTAAACLNCGAPLNGPFCSACGQRAVPPHPTTKELVGDAYDELVGWDGKFAKTLRLLLVHPGALTRAVIEGQRNSYVRSVRLYLLCSILYFSSRPAHHCLMSVHRSTSDSALALAKLRLPAKRRLPRRSQRGMAA